MIADRDGAFDRLLEQVQGCARCPDLPRGPRPVLRGRPSARVLIISQAPGTRAHETGLSFNDPSGDRLRAWTGLDRDVFYDESRVAIMPIGFCYPGRLPRGGDCPPRQACAAFWHPRLLPHFAAVRLTLLVGGYAVRYYLPQSRKSALTAVVERWRDFLPRYFVLPHPSWRTVAWERRNSWFAAELLPELRMLVSQALNGPDPA